MINIILIIIGLAAGYYLFRKTFLKNPEECEGCSGNCELCDIYQKEIKDRSNEEDTKR